MKKNIAIFICGVIAGMLLLTIVTNIYNEHQAPGNLAVQPKLFDEPGECISTNNFKVFQALSAGYALSIELEKGTYSNMETASGKTVLLYDPDGRQFEDEEKIKMPKGKCARQIGTYRYSKNNSDKVEVPVVQIMDMDEEPEE